VLPVGGIKEKVLGALAAGITTVLLPERNKPDLEDVPASARSKLTFHWLKTVDDATALALTPVDDKTGKVRGKSARKNVARPAARKSGKRVAAKPK
jgi:ATP-dependent Lon protease